MALFPKIDKPCPLSAEEFARIDGHCGRCDKAVHSLDGMTDAQRVAFLRNASGPLCVSYRVPVRQASRFGVGAALALSIATPAFADIVPTSVESSNVLRSVDIKPASVFVAPDHVAATCQDSATSDEALESITITGGGVHRPQDAQWIDDSTMPELPMVQESKP